MLVIAGGDSFIYGSELADCKPGRGQLGHSHNTFPALLAKKHNLKYQCVAKPGLSNNAIARLTYDACTTVEEDKFVMICWTFQNRYEFNFDNNWQTVNAWFSNPADSVKLHNNKDWDKFSEALFKQVGIDSTYSFYSLFKDILYMQNYLENNRIPYLFTCVENLFYNKNPQTDLYTKNLYNQIHWNNWHFFDGGGFYDWGIKNQYQQGPYLHFLETAHVDAANSITINPGDIVANTV
jgi:hypothetical protein